MSERVGAWSQAWPRPTGPAHVQRREGFPAERVVSRSGALRDPVLWIHV